MFTLEEALAALEEWGSPESLWASGRASKGSTIEKEDVEANNQLLAAQYWWWQTAVGVLDSVHFVQSTVDPHMAGLAFDGASKLLHQGGMERRPALPAMEDRPRFENQVREQGWFQWERGGAWHYGPLAPSAPHADTSEQSAWLEYGSALRATCREAVLFEPFSRIVSVPADDREPRRREVVVNVLHDLLSARRSEEAPLRETLQREADTFHAIAELEADPGEVSLARHLADQTLNSLRRLT